MRKILFVTLAVIAGLIADAATFIIKIFKAMLLFIAVVFLAGSMCFIIICCLTTMRDKEERMWVDVSGNLVKTGGVEVVEAA